MEVVTVSQINKYIKSLMDRDTLLSDVTVMGEISNFKRHSSGHYYFSVKDAGATISAAMFKWQNRTLKFMPENGMRVLVHGRISVYEPSGQYQIIADSIEPDGVGALYEAYEKLKRQLEEQGWFAPERKKPLPRFSLDLNTQEPAVRRSICTGEMTVGYIDKATGKFHDLMMVDSQGLEEFRQQVGVDEIRTIY